MAIPEVHFTPESANLAQIGLWFGQSVVQGQLRPEVRADISGALRACYRAADIITTKVVERRAAGGEGGGILFLEEAGSEEALLQIQDSLGIEGVGADGRRRVILEALVQRLADFIEKLILEAIAGS